MLLNKTGSAKQSSSTPTFACPLIILSITKRNVTISYRSLLLVSAFMSYCWTIHTCEWAHCQSATTLPRTASPCDISRWRGFDKTAEPSSPQTIAEQSSHLFFSSIGISEWWRETGQKEPVGVERTKGKSGSGRKSRIYPTRAQFNFDSQSEDMATPSTDL